MTASKKFETVSEGGSGLQAASTKANGETAREKAMAATSGSTENSTLVNGRTTIKKATAKKCIPTAEFKKESGKKVTL